MKKVLTLGLALCWAVTMLGQLTIGQTSYQGAIDLLENNGAEVHTEEGMILFILQFEYEGLTMQYGTLIFHEDKLITAIYGRFIEDESEGQAYLQSLRKKYGQSQSTDVELLQEINGLLYEGDDEALDFWCVKGDITCFALYNEEEVLIGLADYAKMLELDEILEEVEEEEVVEEVVVETVPFAYTEVLGMTVGETTWNEGIEALKRFIRYIDSEDETIRFEGKHQWGNVNFNTGKAYFHNNVLLGVSMTNESNIAGGQSFISYVKGLHGNQESEEKILATVLIEAMELGEVQDLWCKTDGDGCLVAYMTENSYGYVAYSVELWGIALAELMDDIEDMLIEEEGSADEVSYEEREPDAWYGEPEVDLDATEEVGSFFGLKVGTTDEYMGELHTLLYEADNEDRDLETGTCNFEMDFAWENHLMNEGMAIYHGDVFTVIISRGDVSSNKEANAFLDDIRTKYGDYYGIEDADFAQFLLMVELGTEWSAWSRVGDIGVYACVIDGKKFGIYYHIPTMREMMAPSRR